MSQRKPRQAEPVDSVLDGIAVGSTVQVWQGFGHGKPRRHYIALVGRGTPKCWVTSAGTRFRKDTGDLVPRYLDYTTFIRPMDWEPTP